jgi:hypothetical protein
MRIQNNASLYFPPPLPTYPSVLQTREILLRLKILPILVAAAKAAALSTANGVSTNGKLSNGNAEHGMRRREAADYYVKGDSIAASELHLRKPAFGAAAAAAASE